MSNLCFALLVQEKNTPQDDIDSANDTTSTKHDAWYLGYSWAINLTQLDSYWTSYIKNKMQIIGTVSGPNRVQITPQKPQNMFSFRN